MIYRDSEQNEYDISQFSEEEKSFLDWLMAEYKSARSWAAFHNRTAEGIINIAKNNYGTEWTEYPLYKIQLDLVANAGIKNNELQGELSNMLVKHI
jgi:hypothetical protein